MEELFFIASRKGIRLVVVNNLQPTIPPHNQNTENGIESLPM